MELTIDKRKLEINYRNGFKLSYWDLLFWQNKPMRVNKESDIATKLRVNLCIELQNLYNCANPENFTINSENNLELDRYFNGQLQSLRARGEEQSALNLEKNIEWEKARLARMFGEKQYEEYKHLVDFFKNSDYPASFQWLMLNETLKNTYRIDFSSGQSKLIVNERKSHQTILGMMNLPSQVLQFIYENASHYTNFKKLYLDAQLNFQKQIAKNGIIDIENVDTFGKGKWIKFNSEHSDLENFEQNVANLKTLVADTPWCTSTLASSHLSTGDFYVFVDFDNKAHIAVKMNGKTIDEVRGIKNGNNQELEEEYRDVAINFLQNNCDIEFGKEWLNKEEWNLRLVKYIKDIDNNNFQIDDVPNLINDLFKKDYKSHGGNSNFKILKSKLDDIKPVFAKYYHCSEHEIFFGNYCATVKDSKCPYKVIIGDAKFEHCNDLGNLNIVLGSADFSNSQVVNLGSLQAISGDVDFCNSKITNLNHLQTIGGNADFCESQVYDLGNLQTIGGNAYFTESPIVNLNKVKNIVGDADFFESQVYDLGDLQTIGGDAYFSECPIVNLGNLESIGGCAYFINSEVVNLGNLQTVGGKALFLNSKISDLGNTRIIGGCESFYVNKIERAENLENEK